MTAPESTGGPPLLRFRHDAMACTFELVLLEPDARYARQAARAACDRIDELERELSRFLPTSDIARINQLSDGQATCVGLDAAECLRCAVEVHGRTGGAFDVSYGSQFGGVRRSGMEFLEFDFARRLVGVRRAGVRIDLGGIGKGYAVDQAVEVLREWRLRGGLIHSGQSSVAVFGEPPGGGAWRVPLRMPSGVLADSGELELELAGGALSGSGREARPDHIVDPVARAATTQHRAAWAAAPSAMLADALSTAFVLMPWDAVVALCENVAETQALAVLAVTEGESPRWLRFGALWPECPA